MKIGGGSFSVVAVAVAAAVFSLSSGSPPSTGSPRNFARCGGGCQSNPPALSRNQNPGEQEECEDCMTKPDKTHNNKILHTSQIKKFAWEHKKSPKIWYNLVLTRYGTI